jgi:poly(U)-specific endoribonuclease
MDAKVEAFYSEIFTDLTLDSEESQELISYYQQLNPPPDKLVWLRATAFRLGCEYLSDDHDRNVSLIRAINAIVHTLEKTCMVPKESEGNSAFDADAAEEKIRGLYSDLAVDAEENQDLFNYFQENIPPVSSLVILRATAFKAAIDFLSEDKDTNISLLRCINVVVHAFERVCLLPKKYKLKLSPQFDLNVSLSDAVQQLWNLDVNRLTPDTDYQIYVQGGKKPFWKDDAAEEPLFGYVDMQALRRPTYRAFMALLDNYKAETGEAEQVGSAERTENWAFLNAIMQTAPMQFCHKYLLKKDPSRFPSDPSEFKRLLYKIWFDLYKRERGGPRDSSGFEHVFVGEVKNGKISGFHNWIQFYLEEQNGSLDYRGYIKPRSRSDAHTDSNDHILTLQFAWNGVEKSVGTSFIGVSPEFEMAVYSMCFLLGEENNEVTLNTGTDEFVLNIKCFTYARDKIGTAFPEALEHYD